MGYSLLFRLLALIAILWVLRRLLGSFLGLSRPKPSDAGSRSEDTSNNMVKDPVCGMYMDSRLAVQLENRKESFYFCSEECKNKYLGKCNNRETGAPPPI
jgi:uncharacterized protein